jgi:chromosome segregation ATPase
MAQAEELDTARVQLAALQAHHRALEQRAADQLREERRRAFAEHEREQRSLRGKVQELESELRSRGLVLVESDRLQRTNQTLQRRVEALENFCEEARARAPR